MTNSEHEQSADDKGHLFFLARLILPDPTAIEMLESTLRELVQTQMRKVCRRFRARTLPIPGSDDRLADSIILSDISRELNNVFSKDIVHESRGAIGAALGKGSIDGLIGVDFAGPKPKTWECFREKNPTASALLGKYWYRHREPDYFDAKDFVDAVTEARAKGGGIPWPKIQPEPPRRLE